MRPTVIDILKRDRVSVAVAESLTAGLLQSELASEDGASRVFRGGVTCYSPESKASLLDVSLDYLNQYGAASGLVTVQMARKVTELFNADIGVATSGYATPCPVVGFPFAWMTVYDARKDVSITAYVSFDPSKDRNLVRKSVTDITLLHLRSFLLDESF